MFKSILENYQVSVQGKVLVHILQKTLCQIKTAAHGSQESSSRDTAREHVEPCVKRTGEECWECCSLILGYLHRFHL